jgi:hypothetical protein
VNSNWQNKTLVKDFFPIDLAAGKMTYNLKHFASGLIGFIPHPERGY